MRGTELSVRRVTIGSLKLSRITIPLMAICILALVPPGFGQSVRSLVNEGNDLYKGNKFTDAEVNYRKALEKENALVQGHFNLGDALHKQGKFDDAVKEFDQALQKAEHQGIRAKAHYNIGNSLLKEQKYEEAVKSYVESLKLNPDDQEAKYNLSYALEKLKQQQQKKDDKQDKKKENKQDKKDQQKDDKQKQDQKDQEKQDQQNREKQRNQASQQEKKMSKADAERILEVLKNNEKEVQKKLKVRQAVRPKTDKDW